MAAFNEQLAAAGAEVGGVDADVYEENVVDEDGDAEPGSGAKPPAKKRQKGEKPAKGGAPAGGSGGGAAAAAAAAAAGNAAAAQPQT